MALQPGAEAQLGVAVAGGGVDVVDAVLTEQLQRAVGVVLRDIAKAAAPKMMRVLSWPVRPKGWTGSSCSFCSPIG